MCEDCARAELNFATRFIQDPECAPIDVVAGHNLNCRQCARELPPGIAFEEWARVRVKLTPQGIQVSCGRHNCNIAHFVIDRIVKVTTMARPQEFVRHSVS